MVVTQQQLYCVMKGQQGVTPEMAVRLEIAFGRSAEFWLRMQISFDLAKVREHPEKISVKAFEPKVA